MDVVVPGISPWEKVLINPYIWHFKFHAVPKLPEVMVTGREKPYFDYFFNAIAANPASISEQARQGYVKAYSTPSALSTGFGLYRSFDQDAKENKTFASSGKKIDTPILYLRGDHESGNINEYVAGFSEAGFTNVSSATIKNCGHFAPEEQPEAVWNLVSDFINKHQKRAQ
jgi:pimeloyl-ACP methyl ester carboxylesterase